MSPARDNEPEPEPGRSRMSIQAQSFSSMRLEFIKRVLCPLHKHMVVSLEWLLVSDGFDDCLINMNGIVVAVNKLNSSRAGQRGLIIPDHGEAVCTDVTSGKHTKFSEYLRTKRNYCSIAELT